MIQKKKNRLILILVGFFLLVIPLFFFCISLKNLYDFSKEKNQDNLRQKILSTAKSLEEKLNPYNYLKIEFNKIHTQLIPELPDEIVEGNPEDSFINNIYNKDFANKLFSLTVKKYSPILITVANNNFEEIYSYISPELEKKLIIEKNKLLDAKVYYDYKSLNRKAEHYFNKNIDFSPYITSLIQIPNYDSYQEVCYDYFSRFSSYDLGPMYTDYYQNQILYQIFKYTISRKGIHGYYSLLIPQSQINPKSIIKAALSNQDKEISIQLKKIKGPTKLIETKDGLDYYLNFTTEFISHLNAFKRLNINNDINKTNILEKQFKISIKSPKSLKNLYYLKELSIYCSILIIIIYLLISFYILNSKKRFRILLTPKLIFILSIIILLPVTGIGVSTWFFSNNLGELIDYNASQNLNNKLNNFYTINQETNLRYLSYILEMKRKIAKSSFQEGKTLYESILTPLETETWYKFWSNNTYAFTENDSVYYFTPDGKSIIYWDSKNRELKNYKIFFSKFLKNLGLYKKNITNNKDEFTKTFSLGFLEQYLTPEIEEATIPLESIPQKDIFNFIETNLAVFFYIKDKLNNNYFIFERKYGSNHNQYNYLEKYTEKINPFWFKTSNEFSDIDIGIKLYTHSEVKQLQWPSSNFAKKELNDLLNKAINIKDSGSEITKSSSGSKIKQWIFTNFDQFIIAGIADSKYNTSLSFTISIIFPILLAYSLLLLTVLTGFISEFINKPIKIYKKALKKLDDNQYGTTINSFSKDEFDNITKAFNEMSIAIKQKEQIKRYVSEKLLESVDVTNKTKTAEGKLEKVTILSSDIRNFTGISEIHEPSEIVEMLNTYFTKMQQAISSNGGIIDKYIGDAIQAVFYDEQNKESQVIRAAKAAVDMRKALEEFNKEREEGGLFTIQNGIGIDTDYAITGTIGTEKGRKDFSVNGDVVSRAANLEAKTKQTQSKILISKNSIEELDCHVANAPRDDEYNSKIVSDNKTDHTTHQSHLIFKEFDNDSVELIDVSE